MASKLSSLIDGFLGLSFGFYLVVNRLLRLSRVSTLLHSQLYVNVTLIECYRALLL
jgi:hypothetical protein